MLFRSPEHCQWNTHGDQEAPSTHPQRRACCPGRPGPRRFHRSLRPGGSEKRQSLEGRVRVSPFRSSQKARGLVRGASAQGIWGGEAVGRCPRAHLWWRRQSCPGRGPPCRSCPGRRGWPVCSPQASPGRRGFPGLGGGESSEGALTLPAGGVGQRGDGTGWEGLSPKGPWSPRGS